MAADCNIHIQDAITDRKEIEKLATSLKQRLKDAPEEVIRNQRKIFQESAALRSEETIRGAFGRLMDQVTIADKTRRYTHDRNGVPFTKKSDAVLHRLNDLTGRNGIDTKMRTVKNAQIAMHQSMELAFGVTKNERLKGLGDIAPGSDMEREVYVRTRNIEEQIDPDTLTPKKIKELLQKYGNDETGRLALALKASNEYTRKLLGRYGVDVKYNKNYVMKRRYDWDKVGQMTPQEFADFLSTRLDLMETFGTADPVYAKRQLEKVWTEMSKEKGIEQSVLSSDEFTSSSANSIARKFRFKDANAEYDVFDKMSVGGMADQMLRNIRANSATAIRISEFGYNPKDVYAQVQKNLDETLSAPTTSFEKNMTAWRERQILLAEKELSGRNSTIKSGLSTFANTVRFGISAGKLGNAVPTALLDVLANNQQAFYLNGEFFGGLRGWVENFAKVTAGMDKEQRMRIASTLGVAQSYTINGEAMRLGDLGSGSDKIGQWLDRNGNKVMNLTTLLPAQTSRSQLASALNGAETFARMVDELAAGKANKFALDSFKEYGFTDAELKLMTSGAIERTETWGSRSVFTASGMHQLFKESPEKVAKALGVKLEDAGDAVIALGEKYQRVIDDFVVRATPTPELATRTLMMKNSDQEEVRVGIGLLTQFMDTPIAQFQNFVELSEKVSRVHAGDKFSMYRDLSAHALIYTSVGVPAFLAAEAVFATILGKESKAEQFSNGNAAQRKQILTNVIGKTAFVPFISEVLANQFSDRYNQNGLDAFGSPAMSLLNDTLNVGKTLTGVEGGMDVDRYLERQLPTNALPVQFVRNWGKRIVE